MLKYNIMRDKKRVIAYLHTHWDREWYREFEVFRLRLLKVFDNVLDLLQNNKIPSFYFDGQVSALLDYLEFRPEKEALVRYLIKAKRLFIGPFYCLVDEYLTDEVCFRKNLEIGLKIAEDFGCEDFLGYFADTFGHSKNIPLILQEYGIYDAVVWRGVPDYIPSEFIFNGVNTINLVRGYFMDIFSSNKSIEEKALWLEDNLDKIAKRSGKTLLLPIGADHLGIPSDISEQIEEINKNLVNYEIELSSIFEYFGNVKFNKKFNDELRDNTSTFVLSGCYSARTKLKQLNSQCSYKLELADKLQQKYGNKYEKVIEYAYKLLLQNQAHDSICGCSTDKVHEECIVRYNKVLQIAESIIEEIRFENKKGEVIAFKYPDKYRILEVNRSEIELHSQIVNTQAGFPSEILYDINKIPVTEDYTTIYTLLKETKDIGRTDLSVNTRQISNSNIKLEVLDGEIYLYIGTKCYKNFIEFVRCKDDGDTYNFAPVTGDNIEVAKIKKAQVLYEGYLSCALRIETSFFGVNIYLNKKSMLLNFKIEWSNIMTNRLWQVKFNFDKKVSEVQSDDMGILIKRKFDPEYNIRENLPKSKGIEAKTNTAPFERFVWTNGLGVITKGLREYEVYKNSLYITLLRSTGIISNPLNRARTTPAGPPIEVPNAQQLGKNIAEFSIGFFPVKDWENYVEEIYPQALIF
ncbi:hypothetical protein J6G99_03085 [bacterium]|nr:hypothetical protein [bacterium]